MTYFQKGTFEYVLFYKDLSIKKKTTPNKLKMLDQHYYRCNSDCSRY